MLAQDHLPLRSVRINASEEWVAAGEGLTFIFPGAGSGRLSSQCGARPLGPGDVVVLNAASGGRLHASDGRPVVFWNFSLSLEHLFPLFASHELNLVQSVIDDFKHSRVYAAPHPLAQECHRLLGDVPPIFSLDHRGQLLRVAAAILSVEFKNARAGRSGFVGIEEHMTQVFETLSVTEILDLSVGELARKFGCSRRHLNRLFHAHFGVAVAALRMEMRLLKALSLLRNPDAKIINVAGECGFNHLGLFNARFKRRFGSSPRQWRKSGTAAETYSANRVSSDPACRLRTLGLCPWCGATENKGDKRQ